MHRQGKGRCRRVASVNCEQLVLKTNPPQWPAIEGERLCVGSETWCCGLAIGTVEEDHRDHGQSCQSAEQEEGALEVVGQVDQPACEGWSHNPCKCEAS